MLNALGLKGLDINGKVLSFFGEDLYKLDHLNWDKLNLRLKDITIRVANDVNSPFCGENGASYIYGRQKGGTHEQLKNLEEALFKCGKQVEKYKQKTFNIKNVQVQQVD